MSELLFLSGDGGGLHAALVADTLITVSFNEVTKPVDVGIS